MNKKVGDFYQYSGAVHIHTTDSDGTKPLEEVIKIGQNADLDFMLFADHMTLSNKERGGEGYYGDTLVLIGYEHNDVADEHHYLLFESPKVYDEKMTAAEYVAAGAADNALGIMAHPDEIRDTLPEYPPYPWRDWQVEGYNGMELWNQMSEWMEKLTKYNKLMMSLSPRKSMVGPTDRILKKWDELNLKKKYVGIAGVDAHAFPVKVGPFTIEIFPYKVHFKCLRTHLILKEPLSEEFHIARQQLYEALFQCNVYFSNMRWGSADKFQFYIEKDEQKFSCGDKVLDHDGAKLVVQAPSKAIIKLVHNGKYLLTTEAKELEYTDIQPGIYRVELWKKERGWIYSNHIRVAV